MPYSINKDCVQCSDCVSQCPTGAIKAMEDGRYWIDPTLCNQCEGYYPEPQCLSICAVNSPMPLPGKKGRNKVNPRPIPSQDLFLNGTTNTFTSALVIWELCNILTQQQSIPWQTSESGDFYYQRKVSRNRGQLTFKVAGDCDSDSVESLHQKVAADAIAQIDIRSCCLNLIYAAHATALERPWEQEFTINDQQIEQYLGLEKRKDLSKLTKLTLIKTLAQQACQIFVKVDWLRHGKIPGFSIPQDRVWHLVNIEHHVQEDDLGCQHLTGLTFQIRAGEWAKYFFNQEGYWHRSAFYQYGNLPKSLLTQVMSIWQQHEGAVRMMLWLLFKTKMGKDQRITVQTLMRIAYGEERVLEAAFQSGGQKRLMRTFESDLEALNTYGLKPLFDSETYPDEIQPLWAKLAELPDDPEAALEFWLEDGQGDRSLTDVAPRGKWNRLMNARLQGFDLPSDWEQKLSSKENSKHRNKQKISKRQIKTTRNNQLIGSQITLARKNLKLSQRELANQMGKSQSWVRDVEKGRFHPKREDQNKLHQILEEGVHAKNE